MSVVNDSSFVKQGRKSQPRPGRTGMAYTQSLKRISDCVKHVEAIGGGYNISVWYTAMDDYSKMAMLSGIVPPILMMGSRIVDRKPSTLNWTSVELLRRPGRPFLLSNVVTLLVIVPPEVDVCWHNFRARDRDGCIFEE